MQRRVISVLLVAGTIAVFSAGCQSPQETLQDQAPEPAVQAAPILRQFEPVQPFQREPLISGDYIVYPLDWRRAEFVAPRIYALLYPKYGPYLKVIPDENNNSLLIYIPPEHLRWQDVPFRWHGPYIPWQVPYLHDPYLHDPYHYGPLPGPYY